MNTKIYFGDWEEKKEANLNDHIVIEKKLFNGVNEYTCMTLGGLLKTIEEKDSTITYLSDCLEKLGKHICPECGAVVDESEMVWVDRKNIYLCPECISEEDL